MAQINKTLESSYKTSNFNASLDLGGFLIYIYIYINTFHSSQFRIEAFFNRGNTQKQECLQCGAILGHFQHRTLQCSLAKTITAPHFIFAVTCVVWCGLEFSQNYNHTAIYFYNHMCGAVYKMRFEVSIFFEF